MSGLISTGWFSVVGGLKFELFLWHMQVVVHTGISK